MLIISSAPVRISLIGGGTDIPLYFLRHGGSVISATINLCAQAVVKTSSKPIIRLTLQDYSDKTETYPVKSKLAYDGSVFDLFKAAINKMKISQGLDITIKGNFPPGSGLGSSSAAIVALIGALSKLTNRNINPRNIAKTAIEIEREILKVPGGWQDQYTSVYGGINNIKFYKNKRVQITPVNISANTINKLEKSLLIFDLGGRRSEKTQQESLLKNLDKEESLKHLETLKDMTKKTIRFLEKDNTDPFGTILHKSWLIKKKLNPIATNPKIDHIYNIARTNGAVGGKILGSGGGGCILLNVPVKHQKQVTSELQKLGAKRISFRFWNSGLQVKSVQQ
ncbi:MAG: hypothetical protein A3D24_02540 [Candidatus Blackburnbacteria bacterium RIFCSPHIGHO2_02_FULL_39_13]|uniref:GHMP kinase n=1 Tax=Candidatus Blackburnbacteria bacterium RIFCSPLOWO2_01_FULL_40_20 TaxID=1797519 RepID=A0A1G1VEK5_9BACT|nr:MAG: hypothetical protein A2694_00185 [Candidatus Blackburnbacteria bacterium RIFCSPHIGHO2_01_FULL_40_17]OGY09258.1 MAG: hypothetical protein A3D24_02540 [Candidatus Blackburnbacteria bacterium RIFCSPHIGHO2_02_FULL_39_13]OGY13883.1 MAG: hypothetical protein A3A77_01130 [Candidatus Blackburnbacteria bacterium RIFCSPLOWO2_01_FULL_40_20]OGY14948.1 MAG: hypothetical protein A3I52_02760 [Candidatus Blackburnbacteria bacterium RIFCSPLOWO2_02_FULL_40_10]HBL51715.1 GHMP kinase [Candidatus Blackburnb